MNNPLLIASYPRSGSTWFRFVLCNLYYSHIQHDFASVNQYIPPIDDPAGMKAAINDPLFYKTHGLHHSGRVIFLHRHVGDVLISEWWYKKKFHDDQRTLAEYIQATSFGQGWREHVNWYFPCAHTLAFDLIGKVSSYAFCGLPRPLVEAALQKSSFDRLKEVEKKGFGIYPSGNPDISFIRDGHSGQWLELDDAIRDTLLEKNFTQLKMLGYL